MLVGNPRNAGEIAPREFYVGSRRSCDSGAAFKSVRITQHRAVGAFRLLSKHAPCNILDKRVDQICTLTILIVLRSNITTI
jgi:hypothetical protein